MIDGKEVNTPGPDRAVVFQSPSLLPWLTARDNVALALESSSPARSRAARQVTAMGYLELLGIGEVADQRPHELSLGTQQCVSLARALSTGPRFLLLDPPAQAPCAFQRGIRMSRIGRERRGRWEILAG